MLKRLYKSNEHNFFNQLEIGETFNYSFMRYTWAEVKELALKNGIEVEYFNPETDEYKKYGCATGRRIN